ncbi:hypothetical protein AB0B04_32255 [Streptomyces xinghaiensis]|uniref:Uncharacterized protein n=2 Tax=Streptomyces TaxID=1883 RepID=A0A3M8EU06_9ACTN|nr:MULTISPECIES: hypothetical protein [Streptomyces]KNE80147.1 hypothetical protein ADZ36_23710 [Streptomyces fradiae]OFA50981.1 hypothetical protein BEN35_15265 [Streptomyces fradiae]PQM19521.1 hypothetical protein Sfr7A_31610 [Streptomyces xinghaiensis]RKM90945.1 hypothetical protein SFRA_030405 [Streptomyces xinghaiensis]RNC68946.1 hypothetical protein DC095_030650 [Streptomyces xinghaiensis]
MSSVVRPGQTYRSNGLVPLGPACVFITAYEPGEPAAQAIDPDTGTGRVVLVDDLHATSPTGEHRHDGYTLVQDTAGPAPFRRARAHQCLECA